MWDSWQEAFCLCNRSLRTSVTYIQYTERENRVKRRNRKWLLQQQQEQRTKRQEEKAQEDTASDLASPLPLFLSVCLCDCVSWIRASFALLFTSRTISQDGDRTAARRHIRERRGTRAKSKRDTNYLIEFLMSLWSQRERDRRRIGQYSLYASSCCWSVDRKDVRRRVSHYYAPSIFLSRIWIQWESISVYLM